MADASPPAVLVTGGASGIGRAVVRAFGAEGYTTGCLDLAPCRDATVSVTGDVREPEAHATAVRTLLDAAGRLDVLVPNAGVHDGGLGFDTPPDELRERMRIVLDIDVIGYVLAMQAALAPLRDANGSVVMTLSDAAFLVGQTGGGVGYTAAKHAALGLLGWAARAFAPDVRVNAVAPGGIATGLVAIDGADGKTREVFAEADDELSKVAKANPLGVVLTADEVARYYVLLASPDAKGLTGQVMRPDGGIAVR